MNSREHNLQALAVESLKTYRDAALACSLGAQHGGGKGGGVSDARLGLQAARAVQICEKLAQPHSIILGDPVGTGKTAVSLVAAHLLLRAGLVRFVLLIAPNKAVADQWRQRSEWVGLAHAGRWQAGKIYVVTKKGVPKSPSAEPAATLIMVDEAHRGLQNDKAPIYKKLQPIALGARLLLITATPFQLSTSGFLNMLEIGTDRGDSPRGEKIQGFGGAMTRVLKAWHRAQPDVSEERLRSAIKLARQRRPEAERALGEHMLTPYPRVRMGIPPMPPLRQATTEMPQAHQAWLQGYQVARLIPELVGSQGDMFQRRLLSSNAAFWSGSAGKKLAERAKGSAGIGALVQQLEQHLGNEVRHPKVAATVDWVCRHVTGKQPRHVLLFCTFIETQRSLTAALQRRLAEEDVLAPNSAAQLRPNVRARFRSAGARPMVLVVRDNLSESIDLDGGQPCLVHHDLTWNPARMAQRWGRVVRISSNFQPVAEEDIFCPVLPLEADRRLFDTVSHRQELVDLLLPADHERAWSVLPVEILQSLRER